MTVAELIAELQKLNPNAPVEIDDGVDFHQPSGVALLADPETVVIQIG